VLVKLAALVQFVVQLPMGPSELQAEPLVDRVFGPRPHRIEIRQRAFDL
jgi:hypothetical protein